jgi:hypothetical protein
LIPNFNLKIKVVDWELDAVSHTLRVNGVSTLGSTLYVWVCVCVHMCVCKGISPSKVLFFNLSNYNFLWMPVKPWDLLGNKKWIFWS